MQEMLSKKNNILDYGSVVYLNYLDLNGSIFYAFSEGIKSQKIKLLGKQDFFETAKVERGRLLAQKDSSKYFPGF